MSDAYVVSAAAVPSAIAAYAHFLSLLIASASLGAERLLIKKNMTEDELDMVSAADIVYGLSSLGIVISGYFRVTQYGKGWEFYAHEPIFWLKLTLLGVMGAASFFPTTKIIQGALAARDGKFVPFSDALVARMTTLINGEILALACIPLTATFMARGVDTRSGFRGRQVRFVLRLLWEGWVSSM